MKRFTQGFARRGWALFHCGEALYPLAQVAREHKRAPPPFYSTKLAGADCLIKRRPTSARNHARLRDAVCKWIHNSLVIIGREGPDDRSRIRAGDDEIREASREK
jgi:hypothetical protein